METLMYEPHIIKDPLIPFIFHADTVDSGSEICYMNWHTNIEILYCTEGDGFVTCETSKYPFSKGDVFVINSNVLHSFDTDGEMKYFCLILDRDFCIDNGIDTEYVHFTELIKDTETRALYGKVVEAYNYIGLCRATKIRCAVLELLIRLRIFHTQNSLGQHDEKNPNIERIKRAMVYIRQNLSQVLTLDEIANHVGISKYYLTREFKKITGQSAFEYINILRCKEAKRMITEGHTVSTAARSCGFENLSYFSRTYKKYIGVSPSRSGVNLKGDEKLIQ